MWVRGIVLVLSGLLPCCWAGFPEDRLSQDAAAPLDRTHADRSPGDQRTADRDTGAADDHGAPGDSTRVDDRTQPDTSVSCDPLDPPWCELQELVTCSAGGEQVHTPCPLGCEGGECCVDKDNDQSILCKISGGDCDDDDPLTFPGQTEFSNDQRDDGTYDYNCDEQDEPEYPEQHDCQKSGGGCDGDGWGGTIPECGKWGLLARCRKVTGDCVKGLSLPHKQACR